MARSRVELEVRAPVTRPYFSPSLGAREPSSLGRTGRVEPISRRTYAALIVVDGVRRDVVVQSVAGYGLLRARLAGRCGDWAGLSAQVIEARFVVDASRFKRRHHLA